MIKQLVARTFGRERSPMMDLILGLLLFIVLAAAAVGLYVGLFQYLVRPALTPLMETPPRGLLMQISLDYPPELPAEYQPQNQLTSWLNQNVDTIVNVITYAACILGAITLVIFGLMFYAARRPEKDSEKNETT